jgi:hypothetical protein
MLARRLTTILPAMSLAEAIETTRIHRVAGRTDGRTALVTTRPCRGGLCYSIAMSTGIGIYCEAFREEDYRKIIARTPSTFRLWRRWRDDSTRLRARASR